MDAGTDDNVKTVYPPQTKFAGGIIRVFVVNIMCSKEIMVYFYRE